MINNENVLCEFDKDNYLKYIEDTVTNTIDFKNWTYERDSLEYRFIIDFKNKNVEYYFKEKDYTITDKVDNCSINIEKLITLKYSLWDEDKEIIIQIL